MNRAARPVVVPGDVPDRASDPWRGYSYDDRHARGRHGHVRHHR